jgi:hypothetical protein
MCEYKYKILSSCHLILRPKWNPFSITTNFFSFFEVFLEGKYEYQILKNYMSNRKFINVAAMKACNY